MLLLLIRQPPSKAKLFLFFLGNSQNEYPFSRLFIVTNLFKCYASTARSVRQRTVYLCAGLEAVCHGHFSLSLRRS